MPPAGNGLQNRPLAPTNLRIERAVQSAEQMRRPDMDAKLLAVRAMAVLVLFGWISGQMLMAEDNSPQAGGNVYFVDQNNPQAKDDSPGSEAAPWKTLEKAFGAVKPGDTVTVKGSADAAAPAAIYERSGKNGLDLKVPGEAGKYITFQVFKGHTVILDGGDKKGIGLPLENISFHRINGFVFRNYKKMAEGKGLVRDLTIENCDFSKAAQAGLKFRNVEHLVMRDCRVRDCNECGVSTDKGNDVLMQRVEVSNNVTKTEVGGDGEGFTTGRNTNNAVFIDCVANRNSDDGFDLTGDNTTMINCFSEGNRNCNVKLWNRDGTGKIRYCLVNCISRGAGEAGIKVAATLVEARIYGCLLYDNGEEGLAFRNKDKAQYPDHVSQIAGCIFANNNGGGVVCPDGIAMKEHHNLYWNNKPKDLDGPALDATSIAGKDPLFEDAGKGDFRLKETSPANGAGTELPEDVLQLLKKHGIALPEGAKKNIGPFNLQAIGRGR
jgi:hypothetical protein